MEYLSFIHKPVDDISAEGDGQHVAEQRTRVGVVIDLTQKTTLRIAQRAFSTVRQALRQENLLERYGAES